MNDYLYNKEFICTLAVYTGIQDHMVSRYTFEYPFGRLAMGCLIGLIKSYVCELMLEFMPVALRPIIPIAMGAVSVVRLGQFVKSLFH